MTMDDVVAHMKDVAAALALNRSYREAGLMLEAAERMRTIAEPTIPKDFSMKVNGEPIGRDAG